MAQAKPTHRFDEGKVIIAHRNELFAAQKETSIRFYRGKDFSFIDEFTVGTDEIVRPLFFTRDNRYLFVLINGKLLQKREVPTGDVVDEVATDVSDIATITLSPDGAFAFFTSQLEDTSRMFDVSSMKILTTYNGSAGAFTEDSRYIYLANRGPRLFKLDMPDKNGEYDWEELDYQGKGAVERLSLHPDGSRLLIDTNLSRGDFFIYNVKDQRIVQKVDGENRNCKNIEYLPGGRLFVTYESPCLLVYRNSVDGSIVAKTPVHTQIGEQFIFSPNNRVYFTQNAEWFGVYREGSHIYYPGQRPDLFDAKLPERIRSAVE